MDLSDPLQRSFFFTKTRLEEAARHVTTDEDFIVNRYPSVFDSVRNSVLFALPDEGSHVLCIVEYKFTEEAPYVPISAARSFHCIDGYVAGVDKAVVVEDSLFWHDDALHAAHRRQSEFGDRVVDSTFVYDSDGSMLSTGFRLGHGYETVGIARILPPDEVLAANFDRSSGRVDVHRSSGGKFFRDSLLSDTVSISEQLDGERVVVNASIGSSDELQLHLKSVAPTTLTPYYVMKSIDRVVESGMALLA